MVIGIGVASHRHDLPGASIDSGLVSLPLKERLDYLSVAVHHPRQVGMGQRTRTVGVEQPNRVSESDRVRREDLLAALEDFRIGKVAPRVEIMTAPHGHLGEPFGGFVGKEALCRVPDKAPDAWVGELRLDVAGAPPDAHRRLEHDPHVRGVGARPPRPLLGDGLSLRVGRWVTQYGL
jgi:hypothetical protein